MSQKFRRGRKRQSSVKKLGLHRSLLETLEPRHLLAGDVIISEVLASNDKAHQDDDGGSSDYIELFNTGPSSIDLSGWHLTDQIDNRTRWTFPPVSLEPGKALLVYASGNDRRDPDSPLHTNFRIARGGEYLGLYQPDGRTLEFEFNELPEQVTDVSFGVGQSLQDRALIAADHSVTVLLPSTAAEDVPVATWTSPDFDDAGWISRTTGLGFDDDAGDGDFSPFVHQDGALDMRGKASSAYIRAEFQIDGDTVPTFEDLRLDLQFDDGFVGYLNGNEVVRMNAPDDLTWESVSSQSNGGIEDNLIFPDFSREEGEFTFNGDASFNDGKLSVTPSNADMNGSVWRTEPVNFGSDYTFSASMVFDVHSPGGTFQDADRDGIGGEGIAFVLQSNDNNVLGTGGSSLGLENTGSTFLAIELDSGADGAFDPDDNLPSHLGINTSVGGSLARTAIDRFNGDALTAGQPGPGSNFAHVWVDYTGESQQLDVYYSDADAKPADPTITTNVDLLELFGGDPALYAGWTASTTAAFNGHEVTSFDIITGIGEIGVDPISVDLRDHIDKLQAGTNVLAFHGLNVAADDEDFLLVPTLYAKEVLTEPNVGFFIEPTPGLVNGESTDPPAGGVTISEPTRIFSEAFTIEIAPENPEATVRYTTDGSLPDENSEAYTGPITISQSTRIRARAFEAERSPGPTSTSGYIQAAPELLDFKGGGVFESNLPLVIIDSFGNSRVNTEPVQLVPSVGVFIDTGEDGRANLFDEADYAGRIGARIRGQSSQGWAKRQYAVEIIQGDTDDSDRIKSSLATDLATSLFGLPEESDWVLNGPYTDKTQINNYLTFDLSREMGQYAPRVKLVEVFVNARANDAEDAMLDFGRDYRGTYVLMEKIKVDRNRIDIERLAPSDVSGDDITGGYVWKKDKTGAEDLNVNTDRGQQIRIIEPSCSDVGRVGDRRNACVTGEIADVQVDWLRDHVSEFEAALYGPEFADPNEGYAKYIDVPSWVDTWLLVEYTKNIDGFRLSTYYHKDQNGKIKQGPAWDYNLSFGNANYLQGGHPEGWYGTLLSAADYPYWDRLFEDPAFEQAVADRWFELRENVLDTEKVLADIDAAVALLSDGNPNLDRPAEGEPSNPIARNFERWTTGGYGTDKYHWPNCYFAGNMGDCPTESPLPDGRQPETYSDYIFLMKRFVELRSIWMDEQFQPQLTVSPQPGLIDPATEVTITAPENLELYYTTDGSDPIQAAFEVIGPNSEVEYLVPSSQELMEHCMGRRPGAPELCFMNPAYEPGANGETWKKGTLGVGFDAEGGPFQDFINTDISDGLKGVGSVAYMRIPFDFAESVEITEVNLDAQYNDGFVAYLWRNNGAPKEVGRANVPGEIDDYPIEPIAFDTVSIEERNTSFYESFTLNLDRVELLSDAPNYLVIQLINNDANSDNLLFDARLTINGRRLEPAPVMTQYTGPLSVDGNTPLFVRAFDTETREWVRGFRDSYLVEVPQLTITELNYNPSPPTADELNSIPELDNDDFEFVEIKNIGDDTNLLGTVFDGGIGYQFGDIDFGRDSVGVVVKNRDAFQLRYGSDVTVLGQYGGNLANNGETISLSDAFGENLVSFTYGDNTPWPQAADGNGGSLALVDHERTPQSLYSKPDSWNRVSRYGGSPGDIADETFSVVINEVLSRTDPAVEVDAIELLNTGSSPVDVGGWYLSDSANNLRKYQVPAGTSITAGGMLVLTEQEFNADPNDPNAFAFSGTEGDRLWLSIPDANGAASWIADYVDFRGSLPGESHARYPSGLGALSPATPSLGEANPYPRVGPVVISELQYNADGPSDAALAAFADMTSRDLEFVEVHNPTGETVSLTDWRLRGGIDMEFPFGSELPAGQTVVVVSFNPNRPENDDRTAAFRAHYGIGNDVPLVGGYQGRLSGEGERVTLLSRDDSLVNEPVVLPLVVQDEVIYDNIGVWPSEADGTGMTLTRRGPDQLGNLGSSWFAAQPSPGAVSFSGLIGDLTDDRLVNVDDVDALCEGLKAASNDPRFDLDGNGTVTFDDHQYLIEEVLNSAAGDANLDGNFDSRDLLQIFRAGLFENPDGSATWATGDWNCDGVFTTSDVVEAFRAGSYVAAAGPSNTPVQSLESIAASLDVLMQELVAGRGEETQAEDRLAAPRGDRTSELMLEFDEHAAHDLVFADSQADDQRGDDELEEELLQQLSTSLGSNDKQRVGLL